MIIVGQLAGQAAVVEVELESTKAELEKAKARPEASLLEAHGRTWDGRR